MKRKILFAKLWSITTSISNKGQSVTVVNFPPFSHFTPNI